MAKMWPTLQLSKIGAAIPTKTLKYKKTFLRKDILLHKKCCVTKCLVSSTAEVTENPEMCEEKKEEDTKPANGTTDSNTMSQSGSTKKVVKAGFYIIY